MGKAAGRTLREAGALREYKQSAGKRVNPPGKRGPSGSWVGPPGAGYRSRPSAEVGALLAWPDGVIRGCRRGGANMGRRRAEVGAPCWRGPTVDQGLAGGAAPTWAGAGRDSGRPVGVARRWDKGLPAGRRQHGPAPGGIRGALLAWSDGGIRGCRRGGANMGRRRVRFEAPCWRGPTVG